MKRFFDDGEKVSEKRMQNQKRVELCARSCYSKGKGVGTVKELVETAKCLNIRALALCDDYSTAGYEEFSEACAINGLSPIYGVTILIGNDRVILIARKMEAIFAINKLISMAVEDPKTGGLVSSLDDLLGLKEDLISIAILDRLGESDRLLSLYDYVGVAPSLDCLNEFIEEADERRILALSDSYYQTNSDRLLFDSLLGTPTPRSRKLRSQEELLKFFPEAWVMENPSSLFETIEGDCYAPSCTMSVPHIIEKENFRLLVEKKAGERLPKIDMTARKRLNRELDAILRNGYQDLYYLDYLLCQFLDSQKEEHSHSSFAASSLVNYVLGASEVNPLEWDLPSEVYMGFDLNKMPDVGIWLSPFAVRPSLAYLQKYLGEGDLVRKGFAETYPEPYAFMIIAEQLKKGLTYYGDRMEARPFKIASTVRAYRALPHSYLVKNHSDSFYKAGPVRYAERNDLIPTLYSNRRLTSHFANLNLWDAPCFEVANELKRRIGADYDSIAFDEEALSLLHGDEALKKKKDGADIPPLLGVSWLSSRFAYEVISLAKPKSLIDLAKVFGLLHGTYTWKGNAEELLRAGEKLENIISDREDVFNFLTERYACPSDLAFMVMEDIRKGKGLRRGGNEKVLREHGVPERLLLSLKKIKYLFSKSRTIPMATLAMKEIYCKIHFPIEFYETKMNVEMKEAVMSLQGRKIEEILASAKDGSLSEEEAMPSLLILEANQRGLACKIQDGVISFFRES